MNITPQQTQIQDAVEQIAKQFDNAYWTRIDQEQAYPEAFVQELTEQGWLGMLIPEEYGGGGGSISDAAVFVEALERRGCPAGAAHGQLYTMGAVLRHGSDEQKDRYLPALASGELRLQSFGVTEPDAGSDTTRIQTTAVRDGDHYVVSGNKVFTSRFRNTDLMLLLVRTTPYAEVERKTDGLSVLIVDIRDAGDAITSRPLRTMGNHETNEVFFDRLRVPVANLVGEEGKGFRYILSGMNAERVLVSSEYIGMGLWFIDRAIEYAREREVFGRPIGSNQGVQFPLAQAYAQLHAASQVRWDAAARFEAGEQPALEANAAKLLSSQAQWAAANAAMDTYGGYGLAEEFGIERRFREARLGLIAPINNNLVLAQIASRHLGLPRSY